MWISSLYLLSISFHLGCSFNQKRFDKLRLQSDFHPHVAFSHKFHSKNGSDLLERGGTILHDDPLRDDVIAHFAEANYDFMIPEGGQEKSSIAAILSLISDPSLDAPTFEIKDQFDWFMIGKQKSQVHDGILETEVSIDTKEGVYIDPRRTDDDAYALHVTATTGNSTITVPVRVDILPSFGVIKVMAKDIKSQGEKRIQNTELASDSQEEIEGARTTPKMNPTSPSTTLSTTLPTTTTTTTPTTVSTTEVMTTRPTESTTVSTTPSTTEQTTTVHEEPTTVVIDEETTVSMTPEKESSETTMGSGESTVTEAATEEPTVESSSVSTGTPSTISTTTVPSTTTPEATTTTTVATPIHLTVEGLSEDGTIEVKSGLSKGELISRFSVTVERDGRPDGTLFNVTVDRSDLFDIQPKSIEQGGKAFLFVRNPHLIREMKGLNVTITAVSLLSSSSIDLPVSLLSDPSSEFIHFSIPESSPNGQLIGDLPERPIEKVLALEGIPFTLINSSLFISCESELCLDRESVDHYEFFVKFEDGPFPIPVVIRVSDINDNPPSLSLTEQIIRVSANRMLNPVAVIISDLDITSDQSNAILLTGDAARFFTVKSIDTHLYDLQLTSSPSNGNYSLIVTVIDTSRPQFPSQSKEIPIVVQRGKARFRKELYERTLAADKITPGDALLRLELEGIPVDEVDIVCLGGNPGWITVESYGGKMSVTALPRKGIEGGEFTLLIGAIDKETSEVVADTRVKIVVEGGMKKEEKVVSPFHKAIYTFKTIREHAESIDPHSSFTVDIDLRDSSVSPSIISSSIFALDSNGVSTQFPLESLSLNGSTLSIERSSYANLRFIRMEIEAEEHIASILIFFSSSSIVIEKLRRERSRPVFALPEGTNEVEISMEEESPLGRVVAVLPSIDASKGENIETRLEGEMAHLFHVQQSTGAIVVASRIDLESMESPFFNLSLLAGEEPFESRLSLQFTIENIDDNPPFVHPDSINVNTSIWENAAISSRVSIIKASDIDSPSLRFLLIGEKADHFKITPSQEGAVITLEKEIDRELDGNLISLTVLVIDSAAHTAEATVNVRVMDVNDNAPHFVSLHSTQLMAVENWEKGRLISVLSAEDEDEGENRRVQFRLSQGSPFISIDKSSGELRLSKDLIGMAGEEIPLTVMAFDSGSPQRSSLLNLTISVQESMSSESLLPKITNIPEDFVLDLNEGIPSRSRIFTVSGISPSAGKNGLKYDLMPSTPSEAGWIDVDENDGVIYLLKNIDSKEKRDISGILTLRSSLSSFTRTILRIHVNSSSDSLATPVKQNVHLVYPTGRNDDWPKILGSLPALGGKMERIVDGECSNSSSISIEESGQITLVDDPIRMENGEEICVVARRGSTSNGTQLRFIIMKEEKKKGTRFIPPHTHSILFGKEGANENGVFMREKQDVHFRLKKVNFTLSEKPIIYKEEKKTEDLSSLFFVDPITSQVAIDPIVKVKQSGFYDVTIEAIKENKTVGEFKREIHSIPSSSQVRLVFDLTPHELGRNAESFETKLNQIIKGRGKAYLTTPTMDAHSNKSSICLHIVLNDTLMPQSTALSLLSLPISDSPLTNLYHAYKVSDLGTCDTSISVSSLLSSSFSSSFIITSSIVSLLTFLLISSILYVCCLLRERDRLGAIEKSMKKEADPSQMGTPSNFYTLTTLPSSTPYVLY